MKYPRSQVVRRTDELDRGTLFCSKLIKMSAAGYAYHLMKRSEYTVSEEMNRGSIDADNNLEGRKVGRTGLTRARGAEIMKEMGSSATLSGLTVRWCLDAIALDGNRLYCIEHKSLFKGEADDWKIRSAATQLLLYSALTADTKELRSGYFTGKRDLVSLPDDKEIMMLVVVLMPEYNYTLMLKLEDKDKNKVIDFYSKKADAIKLAVLGRSWNAVREWDAEFKKKEQDVFFPSLTIKDFKTEKLKPKIITLA